jgi:protein MpaA
VFRSASGISARLAGIFGAHRSLPGRRPVLGAIAVVVGVLNISLAAKGQGDHRVHLTLGSSVRGRTIGADVVGDGPRPPVLVIGAIHGDEPAGIAVADRLRAGPPVPGTAVWIVPDLNPDGVIARTRQNANAVDLNRNFPLHWRPLGRPGDQQYSGPRPLSEPEARIAHALILRLRPRITIWFHQPLGVVDESGGRRTVERRFARLAGLSLRRLPRYPGSATGWQDHELQNSTAFVVELGPGPLSTRAVSRLARAVRTLAR